MRRSRRAVRNVGIDVLCRFPRTVGRGKRLYCFPHFPSGRHFHRGRRGAFRFVVRPVELTRILLVADLLTVGLHLRLALDVLLCLDDSQSVAESLVLDDRCVADTLVFAEETIGKRATLRSDLKCAIRELVEIDVLSTRCVAARF